VKASAFARSSSFLGSPASAGDGSFVAAGGEGLSLIDGRVVGGDGEGGFSVMSDVDGAVAAEEFRARTSRAISRQVINSV
jgi:hypothetical protein